MDKVITAVFPEGGSNTVTVYGLWQWDYGISLQIMGLSLPETVEVHFSLTNGEPVKQEGHSSDGITTVDIPDSMLAGPTGSGTFCGIGAFLVNAWVYVEDGASGRTVKMIRLNVKTRAKPPDYIATPEEKKTWEQLQEGKADRLAVAGRILSLMSGERLLSEITLPAGGGTGTFYISVTQDESGAVTADRTMAEIEAAYAGGQAVYCLFTSPVYNNMPCILPLFVHVTGTLYVFGGSVAMDANQPMYLTLICMADSWMVLGEKLVQSVNGKQGVVVLTADDVGAAEPCAREEKGSSDTAVSIQPGALYVFPEMASLSITLEAPENTGIVNEYHFIFRSGGTATTLTLPDSVNVPSGFSVESGKIYEISILEGCMTYQSWEVS